MSAHLTHEELTDNLLGVSSLTVNAHLLNCPTCANELSRMKSTIGGFRSAANAWSENTLAKTPKEQAFSRGSSPTLRWVLAAAMIVLVVGLTFYIRGRGENQANTATTSTASPVITVESQQSQIEKDNQLLSEVDIELTEAVPAPMQPLRLAESTAASASVTK
jgi:predicted anti-sigma-YlaC factor YlaD